MQYSGVVKFDGVPILHAYPAITAARAEIAKIDRDLDMLVNLILRGGAADKINAKMVGLEARKKELEHDDEIKRFEAAEVIRSLIEAILLVPEGDELKIDVRGDLAGILAIAVERKKPASRTGSSKAATPCGVSQFQMVAGGRCNRSRHAILVVI